MRVVIHSHSFVISLSVLPTLAIFCTSAFRLTFFNHVYFIIFLLQVVHELALVMYDALDTGLKEDEERTLSPGLENLLGHMIAAGM